MDYTWSYTQETYTDIPKTTLCDGFERNLEPAAGTSYRTTIPVDEPVTVWTNTPYPTPRPDCTISEEDCVPYMEDYLSSSEAYQSNTSLSYYTHPPCTTYKACPPVGGGMCKLNAYAETIYYWPATVEGDLCGDRTTITHPEPTRSTVISGTTFVSPSAYISMELVEARSHADRWDQTYCGKATSDFLLALDPTQVSTRWGRANKNHSSFRRLNLADLNEPVPVTAALGLDEAPDCAVAPDNCTDVLGPEHTPVLAAPVQAFRDLNPEFEFCDLHPSRHGILGLVTWIPLEPTQGWWPEPTAEPQPEEGEDEEEEDADESNDGPSVTQVVSTTRTLQESTDSKH